MIILQKVIIIPKPLSLSSLWFPLTDSVFIFHISKNNARINSTIRLFQRTTSSSFSSNQLQGNQSSFSFFKTLILIVVFFSSSQEPFNAEPKRSALIASYVTPSDFFYKRNHGPIPIVEDINRFGSFILFKFFYFFFIVMNIKTKLLCFINIVKLFLQIYLLLFLLLLLWLVWYLWTDTTWRYLVLCSIPNSSLWKISG